MDNVSENSSSFDISQFNHGANVQQPRCEFWFDARHQMNANTDFNFAMNGNEGMYMPQMPHQFSGHSTPSDIAEEAARRREIRLLKNREAARECRRKKKEYVKCLENRVQVLEEQNRALIEELKILKDLHCNNGNQSTSGKTTPVKQELS